MNVASHPTPYQLFVGVDIAAATATVARPRVSQETEQTHHRQANPRRLLFVAADLESYGSVPRSDPGGDGSHGHLLAFLCDLPRAPGLCRQRGQPGASAPFCQSVVAHEPATDAIDAQTLAQLAALLQPRLWTPPPAIYEELEQRLTEASIPSCSYAVSSATSSMHLNTVQSLLPRFVNAWKIWTRC